MLERRPCMVSENAIIPDTYRHQPKDHEPQEMAVINETGNGRPGNHNREDEECGGGGGGNKDEGAVSARKKRTWTAEEDEKLKRAVEEHGVANWVTIERYSGLDRTSKSCRLRWMNHLRPDLKKGSFTEAEERIVVMSHREYGNKWSLIASKLPGRTDNEVKNFWHGRLRRCRRQYLDIYPPNLAQENLPLDDLNDRSHFHGNDHNYAATDDTTSHMSQQNPTTYYPSQKPSSYSTLPNQTQLLVSDQFPGVLPHCQLQCLESYTTQMHTQPIIAAQYQKLSSQPPPIKNFSSSPEQGSFMSAASSSISNHKLEGSPLVSQISSPFNSITKVSPLKQPIASSNMLDTSSLPSLVSFNQKTSQINIPLPPNSCLQLNPPLTPSLTSSPVCVSSELELPLTCPPPELLSQMLLDSSVYLAKPCSSGFELPLSQTNTSHSNRAPSDSVFAVKSQLPLSRSPENDPTPVQEAMTNPHKFDKGSSREQNAQIQEDSSKTDLSFLGLTEEDIMDKCLENRSPSGRIFKNEKMTENSSKEGISLLKRKRKEGSEGRRTSSSSGSGVLRKSLQRNLMLDKRLERENLREKITRREGLLTEISKTGVLLVESAKKEKLVSKLLNKGSNSDASLSQSPKIGNLQFGEISSSKDSVVDTSKERDLRGHRAKVNASMDAFYTLLETQNVQEPFFAKSSSESFLLTSYGQQEMHDMDVLSSQSYETTLLNPDGMDNELVALDEVLYEIPSRDSLPVDPLFSHTTSMYQSNSGLEDDSLNKSLGGECPKNSNKEFIEQIHVDDYWGEMSNGAAHNQLMVVDDFHWDIDRYMFDKMSSSLCLDVELEGGLRRQNSLGRNLEIRFSEDEDSWKRCLGESSTERVDGFQVLTPNDSNAPTTRPEELDNLLEGFPAIFT